MFEQILDLPAHPLLVHAAVVLIPLLALLASAYGLIPRIRAATGWAVAALAVAAPASAAAAYLSGTAFYDSLFARGVPPGELGERVVTHANLGSPTLFAALGLGLSAGVLLYAVARGPRVLSLIFTVTTVLAGLVALFLTVRAGHTGATAVWGR
ncbi:DUF2231 domain-containing protein [Rhizohabitans arisaemae]|uniref:DUF2231 domain-containing protein n=1 Tax=Rhizohabitans arisaemae TaxID=2720610 RepID=UPI0024B11417|nr:DUF2231 domain-containing protein [Rhizohabitans arisaemae]